MKIGYDLEYLQVFDRIEMNWLEWLFVFIVSARIKHLMKDYFEMKQTKDQNLYTLNLSIARTIEDPLFRAELTFSRKIVRKF